MKMFQKGTNCHPVHVVLSGNIKVHVESNCPSLDSSFGTILNYFTHTQMILKYHVHCVLRHFKGSDDKIHTINRLSNVIQLFNSICTTTVDLMQSTTTLI